MQNSVPSGVYTPGLTKDEYAIELGRVVSDFVDLEIAMQLFLGMLMGTQGLDISGYVWRTIKSPRGRIDLMKSLLQGAEINKDLPHEYDKIITRFSSINRRRNDYAHGVWATYQDKSFVILTRPNDDQHGHYFSSSAVEPLDALATLSRDISALALEVRQFVFDALNARRKSAPSQPDPLN